MIRTRTKKTLTKPEQAYSWLAESLGIEKKDCHIGMFDVDMCMRVVDVSENYTATKALL